MARQSKEEEEIKTPDASAFLEDEQSVLWNCCLRLQHSLIFLTNKEKW